MARTTICRCKTFCTTYNPETGRYEGPGYRIPASTAQNHLEEDARAEALDNLSRIAAFRALDDTIVPIIPTTPHIPLPSNPSCEELFTMESEIQDRTSWLPTETRLVFAEKPGPWQEFVHPSYSEAHLSNHGPHALEPTDYINTAYLENERRLCEILAHLHELDPMDDAKEKLEDKVMEGLRTMRQSKEREWNRQRLTSVAIYSGYAVVDSGELLWCLTSVVLNLGQMSTFEYRPQRIQSSRLYF